MAVVEKGFDSVVKVTDVHTLNILAYFGATTFADAAKLAFKSVLISYENTNKEFSMLRTDGRYEIKCGNDVVMRVEELFINNSINHL